MEKNKPFILWGSAGHAMVLADLLNLEGYKVLALFDNNPAAISCLHNVDLYYGQPGFHEWLSHIPNPKFVNAAIAIGGARGKDRQYISNLIREAGLTLPSIIHPRATVAKSVVMGYGCQVLANAVVSAGVIMGSVCIVNNQSNVDHECKLGNGVHIAPGAILCGCVSIGDNVMIGAGACVLPHINIGNNAVIGAGSVVTRDIPENWIVAGNPARFIRKL